MAMAVAAVAAAAEGHRKNCVYVPRTANKCHPVESVLPALLLCCCSQFSSQCFCIYSLCPPHPVTTAGSLTCISTDALCQLLCVLWLPARARLTLPMVVDSPASPPKYGAWSAGEDSRPRSRVTTPLPLCSPVKDALSAPASCTRTELAGSLKTFRSIQGVCIIVLKTEEK